MPNQWLGSAISIPGGDIDSEVTIQIPQSSDIPDKFLESLVSIVQNIQTHYAKKIQALQIREFESSFEMERLESTLRLYTEREETALDTIQGLRQQLKAKDRLLQAIAHTSEWEL